MENLSIVQLREKLLKKEISSRQLVEYYIEQIEKKDDQLNAYITVNKQQALEKADYFDNNFETESKKKLGGIPLGIKDIFSTKDILTTAASQMLDDYNPIYESTVTQKLLDEGAIFIGKTNLDQFCHGSSTITSYYGPTRKIGRAS